MFGHAHVVSPQVNGIAKVPMLLSKEKLLKLFFASELVLQRQVHVAQCIAQAKPHVSPLARPTR
jgi:hypothetical protein